MHRLAPLAVFALVASSLAVAATSATATTPTAAGTYVPMAQKRVVDTRVGLGVPKGAIAGQHGDKATLAGVPSSAGAVQVTVTVASATVGGGLVLWKPGTTRPGTTSLIFGVNQTASNTVVAQVLNSQVDIFNSAASGTVAVVIDITGYYIGGAVGSSPGLLHTIAPTRVINTPGKVGASGPVGAAKSISVTIAGSGHPIPAGSSRAAVDITVTSPTRPGSLIAYATGATRPSEQSIDYTTGARDSSFAIVPLSSAGSITIYNSSTGTVQITVDVEGYYSPTAPTTLAGSMQAVSVQRLPLAHIAANATASVRVNGFEGVPMNPALTSAVLVAVQAVSPTVSGSLIVYPGGTVPGVRHLSWAAHVSALNLILVPLASNGMLSLRNVASATTTIALDVYGYIGATTLTTPAVSPSRYVRNITTGNVGAMKAEGQADAAAGAKLVILEFGAQKSDKTGVQLTGAAGTPLTYADVTAAVESYINGYGANPGVTIGVGTNNDGPGPNNAGWTVFTGHDRGARWAQLVGSITPPTGVTVVGADDIEANFWSTQAQAQDWENGYLGATTTTLIFNGSADGCPFTFGATDGTCEHGWTELQYEQMTHAGSGQIQALPQIYNAAQAIQWANIDATGISAGLGPISFAGILTEHATDSTTFTAAQGFAAAFHALSAAVPSPVIPLVTDIQVNG